MTKRTDQPESDDKGAASASDEAPMDRFDWLEFTLLARQWKQDTMHLSSMRTILASRYYHRILEMGRERATPLILRQLILEGANPYHWFSALASLGNEDPASAAGDNVRDIAKAWIEWGRARYGHQLGSG